MNVLVLRFMSVLLIALSASNTQTAQLHAGKAMQRGAQLAPVGDSSAESLAASITMPTLPASLLGEPAKKPAESKKLEQEIKVAAAASQADNEKSSKPVDLNGQTKTHNGHSASTAETVSQITPSHVANDILLSNSTPAQTSATNSQSMPVAGNGSSTEQVVGISLLGMVKDAVWSKMPWVTNEAYLTYHAKSATLSLVLPQDMQRQGTFYSAVNELAEKMTIHRDRDYILRMVKILSEGHQNRIPMSDTARKVAQAKLQERLALAQMGITLLSNWDTIPCDKTPVPEAVFLKTEDVTQRRESPSKPANGHTDHKENGTNGSIPPALQPQKSDLQDSNA